MNIVIDLRTATDHFPGIGRYAVNLTRAMIPLLEEHDKLYLLCEFRRSTRWDLQSLTGERTSLLEVPVSPFSLRQQWVIPLYLRRFQADIYHSLYYMMPYYPKVATVLTAYDLIPLIFPQYTSIIKRYLYFFTSMFALHTARQIIAISASTRRTLLKRFRIKKEKVIVIPLAPDPVFHPKDSATVDEFCNRLGLRRPYVLYLGSNKPHKNLVRLIQAWTRIHLPAFCLVLAGFWDPRYPQARRQAETLALDNSVVFLGPVAEKDLPALYSGASLFVFPSEFEGFGLPVLEAMACGTPVVTSNRSSLPEVAGPAAFLIDPHDVEALANALRVVLTDHDLRDNLIQKGFERVRQFSWSQCAGETIHAYKKVMQE